MAENVEELGSVETPQTRDVTRSSSPSNFSVEDLRDGSNIFTLVMNQLHTIAESVNDLNQRLSALEQLQGRYGNVVADSVDAQSVKVGGVDVMTQGGDYAPKNHASSQTTYGQATTSNYGHAKLSNDTLSSNSTGTAGVACSTGHKHSQYGSQLSVALGNQVSLKNSNGQVLSTITVEATGGLTYKGYLNMDPQITDPDYPISTPAAVRGDMYICNKSGVVNDRWNVLPGTIFICKVASTPYAYDPIDGFHEYNIDHADDWDCVVVTASPSGNFVLGPAVSTQNAVALFDGVSGNLLKDGPVYDPNTDTLAVNASTSSKWANPIRINLHDGKNHWGYNANIDGSGNVEIQLPLIIQANQFIGPLNGTATKATSADIVRTANSVNGDKLQIGSGISVNVVNCVNARNAVYDSGGNNIANTRAFKYNGYKLQWDYFYGKPESSIIDIGASSYTILHFTDNAGTSYPISGVHLMMSNGKPLASGSWRQCIVTIDLVIMARSSTGNEMCYVELVTTDGTNYVPFCPRSCMRFIVLGDGVTRAYNLHCSFSINLLEDGYYDVDISRQATGATDRPCYLAARTGSGSVHIDDYVVWSQVIGQRYVESNQYPF